MRVSWMASLEHLGLLEQCQQMIIKCKKCHQDCIFIGQGADVGSIPVRSNSSHVNLHCFFAFYALQNNYFFCYDIIHLLPKL
ncbi:hypothetical protein L1987_65643 [Smallanthus sonchifolius]|uniref:Uncharacterized protein n=1 Tax=Smallanthus sonchifolius TaxID=185202 RepID=A0ACB9BV35_9ASTR|nr:hypothetical protein L1987_65643 [Smallanthus sonchifolius]